MYVSRKVRFNAISQRKIGFLKRPASLVRENREKRRTRTIEQREGTGIFISHTHIALETRTHSDRDDFAEPFRPVGHTLTPPEGSSATERSMLCDEVFAICHNFRIGKSLFGL